jgi:hypothetical protein
MSATPEINRANEAGPQPSILGAMQYTLDAEQVVVMPKEDRELYHLHLQTFRDQHQPQGAVEDHLVQSLTDLSWRLNRVVALETNILSIAYAPRDLVDGLLGVAYALLRAASRLVSMQVPGRAQCVSWGLGGECRLGGKSRSKLRLAGGTACPTTARANAGARLDVLGGRAHREIGRWW